MIEIEMVIQKVMASCSSLLMYDIIVIIVVGLIFHGLDFNWI